MTILKKTFFFLLISAGIVFICFSAFLQIYGKNLFIQKIKDDYGVDVSVGYLVYSFPLGIHVIDVGLDDFAQARDLDVQFDYISLRGDKVKIKVLEIGGGRVDLSQKMPSLRDSIQLENLTAKVFDVAWPFEKIKTQITASAEVDSNNALYDGKKLAVSGWADFASKDMNVNVALRAPDAEPVLMVELISKDDALKVTGTVNAYGVESQQGLGGKDNISENIMATMLSKAGIIIDANFSFQTKMSNPRIEASKIAFSGQIIRPDN